MAVVTTSKPTSNLLLLQLVIVVVIIIISSSSSSSSSLLINGHQSQSQSQSPAATTHTHTHSSCRHHNHNHNHHDDDDLDDTVSISIKKRNLLPEELAEEEDLKLYGFGSHHHHESESESESESMVMLTGAGLWIRAMGCSLLVSLASLICLVIIPILCAHGTPSKLLVDSLALFGAGAMLGDAFLHQLPHAFGGGHSHGHEDHDHSGTSHSHSLENLSVGLSILFGIVVFLIVEKIVRFVEEFSGGEHSGSHTHHHHHHHKSSKKLKKLKADEDSHKKSNGSTDDMLNSEQLSESKSDLRKRGKSGDKRDTNKKRGEIKSAIQPSNRVFGYLNLFSDAVHNFTDGIALGSAFLLYGSVGGWSRTLFLLAHEIPQEVGDFGILVRSGFSVSKALFFNFLSALVALAGTALALLLGQDPGQSSLIEGFTAGGFIYISVAGVLAEMNNSGSPSLKSSVSQLISLVSGMGVALGISLIE